MITMILAMVMNKRLISNPIAVGIVESILKISFPILLMVLLLPFDWPKMFYNCKSEILYHEFLFRTFPSGVVSKNDIGA